LRVADFIGSGTTALPPDEPMTAKEVQERAREAAARFRGFNPMPDVDAMGARRMFGPCRMGTCQNFYGCVEADHCTAAPASVMDCMCEFCVAARHGVISEDATIGGTRTVIIAYDGDVEDDHD
jgi:hypothetical protein